MESILVVDDLADVRATIAGVLGDAGYDVRSVPSRAEALQLLETEDFAAAVLDIRLDESDEDNQDGLHLMHEISLLSPSTAIIMLTGYGTDDMVHEALSHDGIAPVFCIRFLGQDTDSTYKIALQCAEGN